MHNKPENGELYIREKIAPKMFKTNRNDKSGTLTELDNTVYMRKTPQTKIIQLTINEKQRPMKSIQDISRIGITIRTY